MSDLYFYLFVSQALIEAFKSYITQYNNPLLGHFAAFASKDRWAEHLRHAGLTVRVSDNAVDLQDLTKVEFAICWQPKEALLQQCPNLKAIQSMGAGVDSLLTDPTLPRHVPQLRVIDP